jgi:hypothetical protein
MLLAGTVVSHYRIVSQLGAGGRGEVYRAEDTKLDRPTDIELKCDADGWFPIGIHPRKPAVCP